MVDLGHGGLSQGPRGLLYWPGSREAEPWWLEVEGQRDRHEVAWPGRLIARPSLAHGPWRPWGLAYGPGNMAQVPEGLRACLWGLES